MNDADQSSCDPDHIPDTRSAALDELVRLTEEMGLYDEPRIAGGPSTVACFNEKHAGPDGEDGGSASCPA